MHCLMVILLTRGHFWILCLGQVGQITIMYLPSGYRLTIFCTVYDEALDSIMAPYWEHLLRLSVDCFQFSRQVTYPLRFVHFILHFQTMWTQLFRYIIHGQLPSHFQDFIALCTRLWTILALRLRQHSPADKRWQPRHLCVQVVKFWWPETSIKHSRQLQCWSCTWVAVER